ncbi:MAG: BrnT family toxin [Deltaproteobacteria bacterium]|nr:BrnT family toxin [Deltaproteobacteria bacterium]
MIIEEFVWFSDIIDKLDVKHGVTRFEVESLFTRKPIFSKIQKGRIKGENLYRALGQTESGRYLTVFFIYKVTREAIVISARDMTDKERKYYAKRKK